MTSKEYLSQIKNLRFSIRNLEDECNNIYLSFLPSGISYDGDKVQTSKENHMEKAFAKIDDYKNRIERLRTKCIKKREEIISQINNLEADGSMIRLLYLRYIAEWSWEDIASDLNYSTDHVKGFLHGKALFLFGQQYSDILNTF